MISKNKNLGSKICKTKSKSTKKTQIKTKSLNNNIRKNKNKQKQQKKQQDNHSISSPSNSSSQHDQNRINHSSEENQYQDSDSQSSKLHQSLSKKQIKNLKQIDRFHKKSTIPIYKQIYIKITPKQLLAKLLQKLNSMKHISEQETFKYTIEVVNGEKGIIFVHCYQQIIQKNKKYYKKQTLIEGNIVEYNQKYGIFWRYEEYEFDKMMKTYEFDEILQQINKEQQNE